MYATDLMGLTLDNPVIIAPALEPRRKTEGCPAVQRRSYHHRKHRQRILFRYLPAIHLQQRQPGDPEHQALQRSGTRRMDPLAK